MRNPEISIVFMSPHHRRAVTLSISLAALMYLGFILFADYAALVQYNYCNK